jgi:hypothetical protein
MRHLSLGSQLSWTAVSIASVNFKCPGKNHCVLPESSSASAEETEREPTAEGLGPLFGGAPPRRQVGRIRLFEGAARCQRTCRSGRCVERYWPQAVRVFGRPEVPFASITR